MSRRGFGEMAVSGCYAAPVFNILCGLGLCFVDVTARDFPRPFDLPLDVASKLSLAFTLLSLTSTIVSVSINNFTLERSLGIYLISLYVIYLVVQLSLLVSGVN